MARLIEVAREQLSNGDTFKITKLGREYQTHILHYDDTPPESEFRLTKKQAYTKWSEIIRHDVLEID